MKLVNAKDEAEKNNLFLKVVTTVKSFDNYNSFYNIYDSFEDAVRRVAVITKNENLEEVYDNDEDLSNGPIIVGDCIWIKEYSLLEKIENIDLDTLVISEGLIKELN